MTPWNDFVTGYRVKVEKLKTFNLHPATISSCSALTAFSVSAESTTREMDTSDEP
jgi:hypothetical protein